MGRRPKAGTREESIARLVVAARALLVEDGVERFSLRAVAKRAGYGAASVYGYFDDKAALVAAVQYEVDAELAAELAAAGAQEPPGRRRVVAILLAYIAFARRQRELFITLYSRVGAQVLSLDDPRGHHRPFVVLLEAVRSADAEGDIRVREGMPHEGVAYGLWASAHGMAMLENTYLHGFAETFELVNKWMLIDFTHGLAPRAEDAG